MRFSLIYVRAAAFGLLAACGGSIAEIPDANPKTDSPLDAGAAGAEVLFTEDPSTWVLAGQNPDLYALMATDTAVMRNGKAATRLSQVGKQGNPSIPWATAMSRETKPATSYRGKRIRMRAEMKTENVSDGGWLWLRLDGVGKPLTICNMQPHDSADRTLKGTHDFTPMSCVLDVPSSTDALTFGFGLTGSGDAWIGAVTFELVGTDVPIAQ